MHPPQRLHSPYANIKVLIRIRPPNCRESKSLKNRNILKIIDNQSIVFDPLNNDLDSDDEHEYCLKKTSAAASADSNKNLSRKQIPMTFDQVYTCDKTNLEIFETSIKQLIDLIMRGLNCCTFVYGATGAGKTFTMLGGGNSNNTQQQHGLIYLTVENLFQRIATVANQHANEHKYTIAISYIEVYNEQVLNLLVPRQLALPLKVQENNSNKTVISGLQLIAVQNVNEIMSWLMFGNRNRTQHPTDSNAESSRSHAIFQVHIRIVNKTTQTKKTVKLSMIDLAGSERAVGQKCAGLRFKEGANINKSLLALGNCINKLADGASHIPYRDSNLTRIIKDSLGGNCQTIMIANVSASSYSYEDTYNTLKYAVRAKKIRGNIKANGAEKNLSRKQMMKKLSEQNSRIVSLEDEVQQLRSELECNKHDHGVMVTNQIQTNNNIKEKISNECFQKINDVTQSLRYATDLAISREKLNLCAKIKKSVDDLQKFAVIQAGDGAVDVQVIT